MSRCVLILALAACSSEEAAEPAFTFKSLFWTATEDEYGQLENVSVELRDTLPKDALVGWQIELTTPGHVYAFQRKGDAVTLLLSASKPGLYEVIRPGTSMDAASTYHVVASREPVEWGDDLAGDVDSMRSRFERLDSDAARPTRIGGQVRAVGDPPAIELRTDGIGCWTYAISVQ